MVGLRPGLVLVLCAVSATAVAQPAHGFERYIEEGLTLREQGRDEQALERFELARRMRPQSAEALGQIGIAEVALRRLVLAEAHLQEVMRLPPDDWLRRNRTEVLRILGQLSARLGMVQVTGNGTAAIEGSGMEPAPVPATLRAPLGPHRVRVYGPGRPGFVVSVVVRRDEVATVMAYPDAPNTELERSSESAAVAEGAVIDDSDDAGENEASVEDPEPLASPLWSPEMAMADSRDYSLGDPEDYWFRRNRLFLTSALSAGVFVGAGITALVLRDGADGGSPWTPESQIVGGVAIGFGILAVGLFVGALITNGKLNRAYEQNALAFRF